MSCCRGLVWSVGGVAAGVVAVPECLAVGPVVVSVVVRLGEAECLTVEAVDCASAWTVLAVVVGWVLRLGPIVDPSSSVQSVVVLQSRWCGCSLLGALQPWLHCVVTCCGSVP